MSAPTSLIGTLPQGSFHRVSDDGPFVMPCLDKAATPTGSPSTCFRPQGHSGRHAFIAASGRVWAVWGDDVHQAKRERSGYVWTLPEVGEPPC